MKNLSKFFFYLYIYIYIYIILYGDIQGWPVDHYATWKVALGRIILGKRQDEGVKHFDDCPSKNRQQIVIVIIIFIVTFIQDIYDDIPDTYHVSREYSVPSVLYLQYMLHVMLFCMLNVFLYFHISTF